MINYNQSLKQYNTFGISVNADKFIQLKNESELIRLIKEEQLSDTKVLILGSGSNILFTESFNGTVIHPTFNNISLAAENAESVVIRADAGLIWDDLVKWCVNSGLAGIENLSGIPGTVGAAPIQNIGAYGVELKDVFVKVRAVDMITGEIKEFNPRQCEFDYRYSIFKGSLKDKYFICQVFLKVMKEVREFNTEYGLLSDRVKQLGTLNLENIRKAVISIRQEKLPDPNVIGNAGSFFKNPICDQDCINKLQSVFPDLPNHPLKNNLYKIPAAWLIENCGWKGKISGNAAVHSFQALVLINTGNAKGSEIYDLSEQIRLSVKDKFGINLDREVVII